MPKPFNIVLVQPDGYVHAMALHEIALLLHYSFESLGVPCNYQVNKLEAYATNIILGYQILSQAAEIPDCDFIIYQFEQLSDREGWFRPEYLEMFGRAREVWDYSQENIAFLNARGIQHTKLVPLGFHERLATIAPVKPDIDFLFYGCVNERRKRILEEVSTFASVHALFGTYGPERDQMIARSKIVLNIHFYEAQIMEQPRISYLFNNRRFVLSENSPVNPYGASLATASIHQMVDTARYWLERSDERETMSQRGYDFIRQRPMTEYLRSVIAE
jgi:hypothetical protein